MNRRSFLGTFAAAAGALAAGPVAGQQGSASTPSADQSSSAAPKIARKGRIKQGLWTNNFGDGTALTFDDMCREAARVGAYGFDLIPPEQWPTLRKYGLEPLIAGAGPVTFENGLIHSEVHKELEPKLRDWIDQCAKERVKTIISIGGQRRGMPYEQGADNAVAFLSKIKSHLEDRNVTLAIEIMNNRRMDNRFGRPDQIFGRWEWGVGVCERVGSKNVKLLCDLYHLQIMNGDLAQNVRDSIQWIAHFHAAGVPSRNELDNTQEVNWRYVASVIADLKYDGYVSHEWRPTPGRDALQSIAQCLDIMDV